MGPDGRADADVPKPRGSQRRDRGAVRPLGRRAPRGHPRVLRPVHVGLGASWTADSWDTELSWGAHERRGTAAAIPFLRRTEVEIHHIDLDLDYTLAHWPEDFVEALLDDIAAESNARDDFVGCVLVANEDQGRWVIAGGGPEISGPPPALLGWMTGRTKGIGLHSETGTLPRQVAWR